MRPNLDRAVEPHENVLIGNFLYMLGLMIGARSGSHIPPGCVNLLQQTPNDKLIGDILAEFDGAVAALQRRLRTPMFRQRPLRTSTKKPAIESRLSYLPGFHWLISSGSRSYQQLLGSLLFRKLRNQKPGREQPNITIPKRKKSVKPQALPKRPIANLMYSDKSVVPLSASRSGDIDAIDSGSR